MFITEQNLNRLLSLHERLLTSSINTLASERDFFKREYERQAEQLDYERKRADAAVDRLIVKVAQVSPISPMPAPAPLTEIEKKAQEIMRERERDMHDVFNQINSVGEDEGNAPALFKTEIDGIAV